MRKSFVLLASLGWLWAGASHAAPIATQLTLEMFIQGLAPITITSSGSVDVTGTTVTVPAGALAVASTIVVPVTSTTSIAQVRVSKLSNLTGTFSLAGVTAQAPAEVCPGLAGGMACNVGGGVGGVMGLTGTVFISIVPYVAVIPINLNDVRIGQGGAITGNFSGDAAAWTTGTALLATANATFVTSGAPAPLTLVSPTYLVALGNALPVFSRLTLTAIPEPGMLALLGSGLVGLALSRRGRRS